MRSKLTGLIVCLTACAMFLCACSGERLIKQLGSVIQDKAGTIQDSQAEGKSDATTNKTGRDTADTSGGTSINFDGEALDWPDWVPTEIPQYKYGKLISAIQLGSPDQENHYGHLMFTDIGTVEDAFVDYIKDLEQSGWEKEDDWVYNDEEILTINMMHTDYYLVYFCGVDEDGSFASIHFTQDESEDNVSSDPDDKDGKDTITVTNEDAEALFTNEKIPEDFPSDLCPIFEPSSLLLAQRISDDEMTIFILMLLSKEDEATVAEFYAQQNPSMTMGTSLMTFESEDGKTTVGVQIGPSEEEHAAQGYQTIITITASIDK